MKANELMIFDLVRRKKDNRTMIVVEVGYDENIGAITTDDRYYGDYEDYHESKVEPIPITPEILEKNGFELGGVLHNTYSVGDSNYTITIGKYGRGQCDIMNHLFHIGVTMECCGTVHELQHALRLCGIEKEIVI